MHCKLILLVLVWMVAAQQLARGQSKPIFEDDSKRAKKNEKKADSDTLQDRQALLTRISELERMIKKQNEEWIARYRILDRERESAKYKICRLANSFLVSKDKKLQLVGAKILLSEQRFTSINEFFPDPSARDSLETLLGSDDRFLREKMEELALHVLKKTNDEQWVVKLLNSGDGNQQSLAMRHMLNFAATNSDKPKFRLNRKTQSTLTKLLESSDNQLRRYAEGVIIAFHPRAIEVGFQIPSLGWLPVRTEKENLIKTRAKLSNLCEVEFDGVTLGRAIDVFKKEHNVQMVIQSKIAPNDLVIRYQCKGEPLHQAIRGVLKQHGLVYRVRNGYLSLHRAEDDNARVTQLYCVRGILASSVEFKGMNKKSGNIELIKKRLDKRFAKRKGVDFEVVDKYRLKVTASEPDQYDVSVFLGKLYRSN